MQTNTGTGRQNKNSPRRHRRGVRILQYLFGKQFYALRFEKVHRPFGIVHAHEYFCGIVVREHERIQIFDVDVALFHKLHDFGKRVGAVGDLYADQFGNADRKAFVFEDFVCLFVVARDKSDDAEIFGVSNGEGNKVYPLFSERMGKFI